MYTFGPGTNFLGIKIESVAFVPQLLLSCFLIPLVGAKKNLSATLLAQTFAFVTFNKVCTSQVC
jgi:phosphatidylinositol glycan class M